MFNLAWPWLLLLLPLPWLVRRLPATNNKLTIALTIPFYHAIQTMNKVSDKKLHTVNQSHYVMYAIWFFLVIAAAGPQWLGKPFEIERSGRNIILALDLSGSMQYPDMQLNGRAVDRLTVVKDTAERFIRQRGGDRIGLVLFGSRAYLQTPLTFDHHTLLYMLNDATIGLAGQRTAIGDAIGLSVKRLQTTPKEGRIVILLTDGANNEGVLDPTHAGRIAGDNNVKIYTIGIGANQMRVHSPFGERMINPSEDLDEDALKEIAKMTDGVFFRATNTDDLQMVYKKIDQLEPVSRNTETLRPINTYYYIPLFIALLLSFYLLSGYRTKVRIRQHG